MPHVKMPNTSKKQKTGARSSRHIPTPHSFESDPENPTIDLSGSEEEQQEEAMVIPKTKYLTDLPPKYRRAAFDAKSISYVTEKMMRTEQFQGFMLVPCFQRMGWLGLLRHQIDGYYQLAVLEWMRDLRINDYVIAGTVNSFVVPLTPDHIRRKYRIDTMQGDPGREQIEYVRLGSANDPVTQEMSINTVFGPNYAPEKKTAYYVTHLTPFARLLWRIVAWNLFSRKSDTLKVRFPEMIVMHALITGYPKYSAAHIILDNIWSMYNKRERGAIPHCHIISQHIKDTGVLTPAYKKLAIRPLHAYIDQNSFGNLLFNRTPTHNVIVDTVHQRKIAFLKAACPDLPEHDPSLPWPSLTTVIPADAPIPDDPSDESDDEPANEHVHEHVHEQADMPPPHGGSAFDMSSLMTGLRGIIGEENQGMYHRFEQMEAAVVEERKRRAAFEDEMRRQHATMEWERQRHRYVYEMGWDERRRYFDEQHNLAPLTREKYDTVFPGEVSGMHHYAGDPPTPNSQAYGRFPAPRRISRYHGGL